MPHIFDVSELTSALKETLEGEFPFVWVKGQISNLARPASGHVYFTLKDDYAVLPVVWFRSSRRDLMDGEVDPLTGEVMDGENRPEIENGSEVLCAGRLSIYQPRGTYQLIAELVQERGLGELHARFEALKKKLLGLGYFETLRKRPLPESPVRVAVVTSAGGAAVRDFIRVASERGSGAEIRVYDTPVQGDAAPARIAEALGRASRDGWAEMAVLIRGGGSIEDLWAFNEEMVACAIFESPIPVLTGIGHEVDTTISDLTADKRAATPSHAAQLLWPERRVLVQAVDELEMDLVRAFKDLVACKSTALSQYDRALSWLSPLRRIERAEDQLSREVRSLATAFKSLIEGKATVVDRAELRLKSAFGPASMDSRQDFVNILANRLRRAAKEFGLQKDRRLEVFETRLSAVNPLGPLDRGYALVTMEKSGRYLRSIGDAAPGDLLEIRVSDGSVPARITEGKNDGQ
jgi:exodeoxyribonuclease VII large subunit